MKIQGYDGPGATFDLDFKLVGPPPCDHVTELLVRNGTTAFTAICSVLWSSDRVFTMVLPKPNTSFFSKSMPKVNHWFA